MASIPPAPSLQLPSRLALHSFSPLERNLTVQPHPCVCAYECFVSPLCVCVRMCSLYPVRTRAYLSHVPLSGLSRPLPFACAQRLRGLSPQVQCMCGCALGKWHGGVAHTSTSALGVDTDGDPWRRIKALEVAPLGASIDVGACSARLRASRSSGRWQEREKGRGEGAAERGGRDGGTCEGGVNVEIR